MQSMLKDILAAIQGGVTGQVQENVEPDLLSLSSRDASTSRGINDGVHMSVRPDPGMPTPSHQQPIPSSQIARSIENLMSQQLLDNPNFPHNSERPDEGDIGLDSSLDWLGQPMNSGPLGIGVRMRQALHRAPAAHLDTFATSPRVRTNSQTPSEGEAEDPLAPDHIAAPLSTMADLAEVAVGMAHRGQIEESTAQVSGIAEIAHPEDGSNKKRKLSNTRLGGQFSPQDVQSLYRANSPPSLGRIALSGPGFHLKELDVLDAGLVAQSEAQQLFYLFFQGCSTFIPIFDTRTDTWDSLRNRSPLLFTTIVGIGARVRDGGGPVSETQRRALTHARRLASDTLFNLTPTAETVQAMILLATYDDNGRIPASHASALAMAIGLDKCLMQLLRTGMGAGLTEDRLDLDRAAVMGSRIILYLFQLEHQLAFGTGRPALFRNDLGIERCREFLLHPLSVPSDVRLVSTVEMMSLRAPLHVLMTNSPDQPLNEDTIGKLREANASFERWLMYWDSVFADTFAREQGDFYRESLVAQREYASLFTNSQLLRCIRSPKDVKRMPSDKRELALRAINNAQNCIRIALRGQSYGRAFKFGELLLFFITSHVVWGLTKGYLHVAVHYTHVCVAFAATFLIRIARLFPRELDLRQSAKDVEELADLLAKGRSACHYCARYALTPVHLAVPAGRYARSLRLILRRARKQHVMPLPSRASSPLLRAASFPSYRHEVFAPIASAEPDNPTNGSVSSQAAIPPADGIFDTSFDPESYQYDFDFAQELWERAGLTGGNDSLPLCVSDNGWHRTSWLTLAISYTQLLGR
jgi:hypothetical protein